MPFNIDGFRSALKEDVVKAHNFEVIMPFPLWARMSLSGVGVPVSGIGTVTTPLISPVDDFQFFCKSTVLPPHDIGVVEVPYWGGRKIQLAGDRSGNEWSITVISDARYRYRAIFERWQAGIVTHKSNLRKSAADTSSYFSYASGYMVDAQVIHYGQKKDETLRIYKLIGVWPLQVSNVDVSWDTTDAYEEYQVTFRFQWMEIVRDNELS